MGFNTRHGHSGPWRPRRRPWIVRQIVKLLSISAGLGVALVIGALSYAPSLPIPFANAACNIKGNISVNTGERIYHVPGQEYYSETIISPLKGERWFCSEDEEQARAGANQRFSLTQRRGRKCERAIQGSLQTQTVHHPSMIRKRS